MTRRRRARATNQKRGGERHRKLDESDGGREPPRVEPRLRGEDERRDADGCKRSRRRVGDEAAENRLERIESDAHHDGARNRHRRPEARHALHEVPEPPRDEKRKIALVAGKRRKPALDLLLRAGLHDDGVGEERRNDDEPDRKESRRSALERAGRNFTEAHAPQCKGLGRAHRERGERGLPRRKLQPDERNDKHRNRNAGKDDLQDLISQTSRN